MSKTKRKAPVKTATKTKAPKTTSTGGSNLKISRVALDSIKFKPLTGGRSAQYREVLEQMKALIEGKGKDSRPIQIDVPKGIKAEVLHNRLNSVFRARAPKPPAGLRWAKRTALVDDGGEVVVVMLDKAR